MSTQTFNLSLSKDLVKKLDEQAKKDYSSRSDYVRKAVINQLSIDQATSKSGAVKSANKLLDKYRQDFENLAKR